MMKQRKGLMTQIVKENLVEPWWVQLQISIRHQAHFRVPTGQGKVRESQGNLIFLQGQGKVREFCKMVREIRKSLKVREF